MKRLTSLLIVLMAGTMMLSSFKTPPTATYSHLKSVKGSPYRVGTWHWVDPSTPDLYQDFYVYVDYDNQTAVMQLRLIGQSTSWYATGTFDGTNVSNVDCAHFAVVNGYGPVL